MAAYDLFPILHRLAASQEELRLFNVYQGVPISYPAVIQEIGPLSIRIRTEKYQMACLYREKETYLHSELLPAILTARVAALDLPRLEAVLTALRPVHKSVSDRRQVRVCPKRPIQGELITRELSQSYRGELADLSRDGLAIYLPARYFYPRIYHPGARLSLTLRLPVVYETGQGSPALAPSSQPDPLARFDRSDLRFFHLPGPASAPEERRTSTTRAPLLQVQGTIANTIDEPSCFRVRIGVSIFPNDPSRPVIARFIAQRQSEILRDLKALSDLFY